jgi:DNA-binding transcriptional MerR regulator
MIETLLPPQTYFSIREVSQTTQVKPYVIRYWETQFGALRPARRESGQRKFTQKDIATILQIKDLLYEKRFTIAGAKRCLKQTARRGTAPPAPPRGDGLRHVRKDLEEALRLLQSVG